MLETTAHIEYLISFLTKSFKSIMVIDLQISTILK